MQKSVPLRNAIKIFCLQNVVCGIIIVWYKIWWQSLWHAGITAADAAFGRGTGPILVHFVRCTGTESSLLNCSHSGIDYFDYYYDYYYLYHYCSYYNDAGVVCPSCKLCGGVLAIIILLTAQLSILPCLWLWSVSGWDMCWLPVCGWIIIKYISNIQSIVWFRIN